MYAQIKKTFDPKTPSAPKQALENFHLHQKLNHRCYTRSALTFADTHSLRTDDTIVYHNGEFQQLAWVGKTSDFVHMRRLKTTTINSKLDPAIRNKVRLPWCELGVRFIATENLNSKEKSVAVRKSEITAKAIRCGNVISSICPEWIVT